MLQVLTSPLIQRWPAALREIVLPSLQCLGEFQFERRVALLHGFLIRGPPAHPSTVRTAELEQAFAKWWQEGGSLQQAHPPILHDCFKLASVSTFLCDPLPERLITKHPAPRRGQNSHQVGTGFQASSLIYTTSPTSCDGGWWLTRSLTPVVHSSILASLSLGSKCFVSL